MRVKPAAIARRREPGGGETVEPRARPSTSRVHVEQLVVEGLGPLDPSQVQNGVAEALRDASWGAGDERPARRTGGAARPQSTIRLPAAPSSYEVGLRVGREVRAQVSDRMARRHGE